MSRPAWAASLADAVAILAVPQVDRAHYLIHHQSMRVGLYAPLEIDDQTPHAQDEVYIIASGGADFTKDQQTIPVKTGDVLFVEAGREHRFEKLQDNFTTWVIFWGPEGGEDRPRKQIR